MKLNLYYIYIKRYMVLGWFFFILSIIPLNKFVYTNIILLISLKKIKKITIKKSLYYIYYIINVIEKNKHDLLQFQNV